MKSALLFLPVLLPLANAYFSIKYPASRGDTKGTQDQPPCGGLDASTSTRTRWPLSGGSLALEPEHPWAITSVNLGLGTGINASTEFTIPLVAEFNQTGAGIFCLPLIPLPQAVDVREGMNASMQIVQVTDAGEALYNCADITFASDAVPLQGGDCMNSTGVWGTVLEGGTASAQGGSKNLSVNKSGAWLAVLGVGVLGIGALI